MHSASVKQKTIITNDDSDMSLLSITNESLGCDFPASFSFITFLSTFSTNYHIITAVLIMASTDFALLCLDSF